MRVREEEEVESRDRMPQELQARQQGLRRGQAGLGQQLERLTDAYLAGVVALDEYRRRRGVTALDWCRRS